VVTAPGLPPSLADSAYATTVVDRTDLTEAPQGQLDDMLRGVGGFQLFRRQSSQVANPTTQGPTLRGLSGNAAARALVLLDGVPQDDPFGGWIAWSALRPMGLGVVRITRGGGSVTSGPGALTGVIALEGRPIGEDLSAELRMQTGSRRDYAVEGWAGGPVGERFSLAASGIVAGTNGYILLPEAQRGPVDVATRARLKQGELRAHLRIGETSLVDARVSVFEETKVNGLALAPNATDGVDASLRWTGSADRVSWEALAYIKDRDFSSGFAAVNTARTLATPSLDQFDVPARAWGLRGEVRAELATTLNLSVGIDARVARGTTHENFRFIGTAFTRLREAGGSQRTIGGFAELSWQATPSLLLTAGGRADGWKLYDGRRIETSLANGAVTNQPVVPDRSGTLWSARAGLAWQVAPAWSVRAAAYRGTRLPTLNELHRPFRVGNDVTEANPLLKPERLDGVEGGVRFAPLGNIHVDATLYWNRLHDAIANITLGFGPGLFPGGNFLPAGGTYRQRLNVDRMESWGVELMAEAPLGPTLDVNASYVYARARIARASISPDLEGLRPAQSPRHQGRLGLAWRPLEGISANASLNWISGQYDDDQNQRLLKGAATVDARVTWRPTENTDLSLSAQNLFDKMVVSALSGTGLITRAAPRTMVVEFGLHY